MKGIQVPKNLLLELDTIGLEFEQLQSLIKWLQRDDQQTEKDAESNIDPLWIDFEDHRGDSNSSTLAAMGRFGSKRIASNEEARA